MRDLARLLVVVLAVVALPVTARAELARLLAPQELAALTEADSVVVLDVRDADPDEGATYAAGHIPGAISAPYPSWRGPAENPGRLPALETLESLVARAGIDGTKPVVLVHAGTDATDFGAAARVFWTLRYLGLDELAILNGGMAAWQEAGLPLTTATLPVVPSAFEADVDPTILATRGEVEQSLAAGGESRLLDARPQGFFWGKLWHDAAHRPGTIPSAQNFTHERWFIAGGPVIVGPDEARRIALEAGLDEAPITVSFCNTGHWAATNWFALSELAGLPGVKLYPESVVDWSQAGLPMQHVPGRIEWLWLSTRKWFQQTFG